MVHGSRNCREPAIKYLLNYPAPQVQRNMKETDSTCKISPQQSHNPSFMLQIFPFQGQPQAYQRPAPGHTQTKNHHYNRTGTHIISF